MTRSPARSRSRHPKLGRPKIGEPVLIMIWPGAWLNASVTIPLTTAMSSTTVDMWGKKLGELGAALAVPGKLELGSEQLRVGFDERRAIPLDQLGRRKRAVEPGQLRLVVEHLEMARRPGHEQEQAPAWPWARDEGPWEPAESSAHGFFSGPAA